MDNAVQRQLQATMEAMLLSQALRPLTHGMPLGEEAADAFARAITEHLGVTHGAR